MSGVREATGRAFARAALLGNPSDGFGGKTIVYLEPVAYMLSKKSGRPVKMVMSREEVFRGTGPAAGAVIEVKLGAKKDGTLTAADAVPHWPSLTV